MNNIKNNNPWLGLKTYEEGQILYGRTDEINTLSQNILFNIQTIIYGKSGIGKSSILNAGVYPILRRSNFFPVNIRLVHNQPEKSYNTQIWDCVIDSLYHLRREILTSDGTIETIKDLKGRYEELAPKKEEESLWEMFHRNVFYDEKDERIQPVLVFDQFEEIFTREKDLKKIAAFFNELADLINNVVPAHLCTSKKEEDDNKGNEPAENDDILLDDEFNAEFTSYMTESNFHIVLSLREDFLSHLERNISNIPSLKHNRYCLKPLSEEQAASIIMDPAPGLVSIDVAKEIISKATGVPTSEFNLGDEPELEVDSAILSLFMSELYDRIPSGSRTIEKSMVIELGDNIIQEFYERTISNIAEDCAEYLEHKLITEDGRRDSVYESHIIKRKKFKASDLEFLKKQRLIREFPWNDGIRIEFIHDVLCPIIIQRKEQRKLAKIREEEERKKEIERERIMQETKRKEERLRRKNRNILISSISIFVAAAAALFGYLYCFEWEYKEYYESFVWRYEMPFGINRLSEDELKERASFFELSKDGRLGSHWKKVRVLNGSMNLITGKGPGTLLVPTYNEQDDEANIVLKNRLKENCIWELVTDRSGKMPLQVKFYDRRHELICCFSMVCHYENDTLRYAFGQYTDEYGQPIQSRKNGASIVKITFDDYGFRSFIEYFDAWKNRARNYDNALAQQYEYSNHPDSLGLLLRYGSANASGEYVYDKIGNSGSRANYEMRNGKWLLTRNISLDPEGNICPMKQGYSITEYEYDEKGRETRMSYYDAEHNPAVDLQDNNTHRYEYHYDRYGNITDIYYYDINGELQSEGLAHLKVKIDSINGNRLELARYDCNGNLYDNTNIREKYEDERHPDKVTEIRNLDIDGNIVRDIDGVYVTKYEYNADGNLTGTYFYEEDGITPMLGNKGYWGKVSAFENGKHIEDYYIGTDGELTATTEGYAKTLYAYDDKGNRIEETYYDSNNRKYSLDDYCTITYKYDAFNNQIQKNYKDFSGNNAPKKVVVKSKYDAWGNEIEMAYFDSDEEKRVENMQNIHRTCYGYDSLFYLNEVRYYDKNNELTGCPEDTTYAIVRYVNDEFGNRTSTEYFDKNEEACDCADGYHRMSKTLDACGRVISEKYYGANGNRRRHTNGSWEGRCTYDRLFIYKYATVSGHDMQGNLMNTNEGWAYKTFKYDKLGNNTEIAYFDKDSIPFMHPDGHHKAISTYEGYNETRIEYYDKKNKLLSQNAIIVNEYDSYNNLLSRAFYNGDGSNGETESGWHRASKKYDEMNRCVELMFVDKHGMPVDVEEEGRSRYKVKYTYDENGESSKWHYKANGDSVCIDGHVLDMAIFGGHYSGQVKEGLPHGKGFYMNTSGTSYEGEWKYGRLSGRGKYRFDNGDYYVGYFEDDKFNGYGTTYTGQDSIFRSGYFIEDKFFCNIMTCVDKISPNSLAESEGILSGDIIIEYNEFNYFKNGNKTNDICKLNDDFEKVLENSRDREKHIKIARKENDVYVLKEFHFPPGMAGITTKMLPVYQETVDMVYDTYMK